MLKFSKVAAQGEITIIRLGNVKKKKQGFTPMQPENGRFIIGHSETGHHHVLDRIDGVNVMVMDKPPAGMRILHAILENPTSLNHLREYDTHESIMLEPGEYEFRIAREFDHYEELARKSAD
jgi:hypothetical protein